MNVGDLHKVWEIRTLKKKVGGDEARKFLEKIAKQVQPIMRKHKWRVKVLSEMCPKNPRLLGLNVGHGLHVKLRLRRPNTDWDFYPFDEVLDTMLHELCHNAIGPHNVSFYKLWDDLRKECEELMSKGISGSGDGFDLRGRRLGGSSRQPPLSSLRQTALAAAQNRARQGSLLPPGPNRLGGDKSIMSALTPVQAAAMAAERRFQDDIWCGLEEIVDEDETSNGGSGGGPQDKTVQDIKTLVMNAKAQKRVHRSDNAHLESRIVDLTDVASVSNSAVANDKSANKKSRQTGSFIDLTSDASTSGSSSDQKTGCNVESNGWECMMCTLLNPPLAPICELCGTHKPKEKEDKYKAWSCKFCTLENDVKMEKCGACGQWRYSYGQPIATPSPNVGT
ncbi:putative Zinc finger, RanBP2-type, WLM domain, Zinc finger, RanBP2-type superfamily [Helianthus annuus]|nr:putative Zinc finger, RanBP2-type, WLM domain, Zinc finger, RanBP2-type superfamily [Helianthus annuus]